jgi:hypothetical protein
MIEKFKIFKNIETEKIPIIVRLKKNSGEIVEIPATKIIRKEIEQ